MSEAMGAEQGTEEERHADCHQTHSHISLSSSLSVEVNHAISMKWDTSL